MKVRNQVQEEVFDRVSNDNAVLNTGWTIGEIEADLDRRETVMEQIEEKFDSFFEEKKHYLEKALEAGPRKTVRFYAKAKEADMYKSFWSELWENLMIQQFFLIKLILEAKRRSLLTDPGGEFDFEIDIGSMDAEAVKGALDASDIEQSEAQDTIEAIDMHLNRDEDSDLSLDLSRIREEAGELEAAIISSGEPESGSSMEAAINHQIEEELKHERERS